MKLPCLVLNLDEVRYITVVYPGHCPTAKRRGRSLRMGSCSCPIGYGIVRVVTAADVQRLDDYYSRGIWSSKRMATKHLEWTTSTCVGDGASPPCTHLVLDNAQSSRGTIVHLSRLE